MTRVRRTLAALSTLPAQAARYRRVVTWIAVDAVRRQPAKIVLTLAALLAAQFIELAGVAAVLQALSALEAGEPWSPTGLGRLGVRVRDPTLTITLAAGAGLGLFVLAAGLGYVGQRLDLRVRVSHQERLSADVLRAIAARPEAAAAHGVTSSRDAAWRGWADSYATAAALSMFTDTVISLGTLLVLLPIAVVMQPIVALILTIIMGVAALALWQVNLRGSRRSETMRVVRPLAARTFRRAIRAAARSPVGSEPPPPGRGFETFTDETDRDILHRNAVAYEGRLAAVSGGTLVGGLALGAAISASVLILGREIVTEGGQWSDLIAYLVVLRYTMTMFRTSTAKLTAATRFYTQAARVRHLLRETDEAAPPAASAPAPRPAPDGPGEPPAGDTGGAIDAPEAPPPRAWRLRAPDTTVPGAAEEIRVEAGQRLALATTLPFPNRLDAAAAFYSVLPPRPARHAANDPEPRGLEPRIRVVLSPADLEPARAARPDWVIAPLSAWAPEERGALRPFASGLGSAALALILTPEDLDALARDPHAVGHIDHGALLVPGRSDDSPPAAVGVGDGGWFTNAAPTLATLIRGARSAQGLDEVEIDEE